MMSEAVIVWQMNNWIKMITFRFSELVMEQRLKKESSVSSHGSFCGLDL